MEGESKGECRQPARDAFSEKNSSADSETANDEVVEQKREREGDGLEMEKIECVFFACVIKDCYKQGK